jgi:trehalose 6-phosphate phosphatase
VKYLFSRGGLEVLREFVTEGTLLAFDFDGTLAPIVKKRDRAALPAQTSRLLKKLSRLRPVALLSGRELSDLKSRVPFPLLAWIGNHGMEGVPGGKPRSRNEKIVGKWAASLAESLPAIPGTELENKRYSLTLHYRESKRPAKARSSLLAAEALKPAPHILPGKKVLNLLTPGHTNKGLALQALMKAHGFGKALFVGDDDTDEDVFRLQDPRIFSLRVGVKRSSLAQAYLRDQKEVETLLSILLQGPRAGR